MVRVLLNYLCCQRRSWVSSGSDLQRRSFQTGRKGRDYQRQSIVRHVNLAASEGAPHPWHSRARGGAVHSINPGLMHCSNEGLFDHLVSTGEHIGRDSQANGFGGFQIDDKFKLGWLFYR